MHTNTIIQRREPPVVEDTWDNEIPIVLARIYAARNITSPSQLQTSLQGLYAYESLKGIESAIELLVNAVETQQRICIVGDFDADGATSCALAIRALQAMGAAAVNYEVPNRFEYGYGLTPEIVELVAQNKPDVIITVDNGISSIEGVAAAKQHGIKVLITDHHLPGAKLPEADAIVNPNQTGDTFPSKALAGVGVTFYVMMALRAALQQRDWFAERELPKLAKWLDLVALGTVADVVPLDQNNRILVAQGLARIRSNQCCAGISALLKIAGRKQANCVANDIGFAIAPRLNAAGRLEDMSIGIECLLTDDIAHAQQLAETLDSLNRERRDLEQQMQAQALVYLDALMLDEEADEFPWGVCLYDPSWHQGIVGILASRVKDRLHRPVIVFAQDDEHTLKGSARSIAGLHIRDTLDAIATQHPDLITKFGGHAMAAGLSIKQKDLERFQVLFSAEVKQHLENDALQGVIHSDGELAPQEFNLNIAQQLRYGGPWGQSFPEPVFDGVFELLNWRMVGERHLKMQVRVPDSTDVFDAIAFNQDIEGEKPNQVHLAYKLDINDFRNQQNLQLLVQHVMPIS